MCPWIFRIPSLFRGVRRGEEGNGKCKASIIENCARSEMVMLRVVFRETLLADYFNSYRCFWNVIKWKFSCSRRNFSFSSNLRLNLWQTIIALHLHFHSTSSRARRGTEHVGGKLISREIDSESFCDKLSVIEYALNGVGWHVPIIHQRACW